MKKEHAYNYADQEYFLIVCRMHLVILKIVIYIPNFPDNTEPILHSILNLSALLWEPNIQVSN